MHPAQEAARQDFTTEQRRENYEMNSNIAIIETVFCQINAYKAIGGV